MEKGERARRMGRARAREFGYGVLGYKGGRSKIWETTTRECLVVKSRFLSVIYHSRSIVRKEFASILKSR